MKKNTPPAPDSRVRIGVVCPSVFEYRALHDLAVEAHAAVCVSGMGKVRSAGAVYELNRKNPGLQHLLLVGFAGGLSGLEIGDLIEPKLIIEQDYCAEPFEKFPNRLRLATRKLLPDALPATLLTQDRFLKSNPYTGTKFVQTHPRLACDMEAYAVAWSARRQGLGCSVVKLISDRADSTADHDFLDACRKLRPCLRKALTRSIEALSESNPIR